MHAVKVKWLSLNGNKYISERSLIIVSATETLPVFALIKNIYLVDSSLYCLEYQLYETIVYNRNLLAYEVMVPNVAQATEVIDAEKLIDYIKNGVYVLTKYNVDDVIALRNDN